MHSIPIVSGTDTLSTQSNVSPTGSASNSSRVRCFTVFSRSAIWLGLKAGAITLRCAVWTGGSAAMKLGRFDSGGGSAMTILPFSHDEENVAGSSSTACTSACVATDQ